jgi:hypothetical protein
MVANNKDNKDVTEATAAAGDINLIISSLQSLLGADAVTAAGGLCTASPASVEQVAAVVAWAADRRIPLTCSARPRPTAVLRLSLHRLNAVRFYDPGDLTIGVDAGITAAALNARLAPAGQWLPFDVPRPHEASVGAILAAHGSGPLRHAYGSVRDFTIGIEFVSADGKVVRGGGRVVKNVAGYDLMKLLIGSRGTLGVIVAANFKVFPRLAACETLAVPLPAPTQPGPALSQPSDAYGPALFSAERFRSLVLHSPLPLVSMELVCNVAAVGEIVARHAGQSGDVHLSRPVIVARFAGSERVRARIRATLTAFAREIGTAAVPIGDAAEPALWQALTEWPAAIEENARVLALSVPAAAACPLLARYCAEMEISFTGRLALGLYVLRVPAIAAVQLHSWRRMASDAGGYLTDCRAVPFASADPRLARDAGRSRAEPLPEAAADAGADTEAAAGPAAAARRLMRQLKREFDPNGIMNPRLS